MSALTEHHSEWQLLRGLDIVTPITLLLPLIIPAQDNYQGTLGLHGAMALWHMSTELK